MSTRWDDLSPSDGFDADSRRRRCSPEHTVSAVERDGRRSWPSTTSPRCSPPWPATCGAGSASATGSCAPTRAPRRWNCWANCAVAATPGADRRRPADARHGGHRLPGQGARRSYPDAKRVLLTAYADTAGGDRRDQRGRRWTTTCSSRGTRPRSSCSRSSAICWRRGRRGGAGGGRRAGDRPPLLQGHARPARLPGAQPHPRPLAGRRARQRGAGAAGGRRRARRPPAGRAAGGRLGARAPDRARAGRAARRGRASRPPITTTW